MSFVDTVRGTVSTNPLIVAVAVPAAIVVAHVVPWLIDTHGIRSVPGPVLAKFSDAWLGWVAAHGHRSEVVHEMHKRYGPIVRLAPNHISIADPSALQVVYAHGNGATKSEFYDAFVSITRGLFNSRDRAEHARKRKIVSHIFSQKNVLEFEPHVREHVGKLLNQWDRLCDSGANGLSGDDGESGWHGHDGRVLLDCLPWYNYLAFDIIGDLAFGRPFDMLVNAKDSAPVAVSSKEAMDCYGTHSTVAVKAIPAVQILNDRGEFSASIGVLPPWWRPLVSKFIPWYRSGSRAVGHLSGMAVAAVAQRLDVDGDVDDRNDLLSKLQAGKDDEGKPMGRAELTAEALTQLIAGSDTTSNSSCAITYYLAAYPTVQTKLQAELDEALGSYDPTEDPVTTFNQVKKLPYLETVINEALRVHSTSGIGLPRVVPAGAALTIGERTYGEGTVLGVPSYSIHRDTEVWGADADAFRPERWFEEERKEAMQKTFNPFSFGPRACVGRNLANMELLVIIASVLRRYNIVLERPDQKLDTCEGFLRKPLACRVGLKRRFA